MRSKKRGVSLVELLMVVVIVGILISLLIPAVQAAREAARRAQCNNHLKQLGLACLSHESAQKFYPTGGWTIQAAGNADRGAGRDQPGPWLYNILPYVEQQEVHGLTAGKSSVPHNDLATVVTSMVQTPISTFYCPTRRQAKAYPMLTTTVKTQAEIYWGGKGDDSFVILNSVAKTDYAVNGGSEWINGNDLFLLCGYPSGSTPFVSKTPITLIEALRGTTTMKDALAVLEGSGGGIQTSDVTPYGPTGNNRGPGLNINYPGATGISYIFSEVTAKDVQDGTSNTYLAGEKYLTTDWYDAVDYTNSKYNGDLGALFSATNTNMRCANGLKFIYSKSATPLQDAPGRANNKAFGGPHSGGFNMVFCDGSVRSVSYGIDEAVHNNLANRRDGKAIDMNNLNR